MKPFELHNNIFWIGALHPDLKIFDILMKTKHGTTYNSYLIKEEKTAIIDTVKTKFSDEYLQNIASLTDFSEIDYIIVNHCEPDHSGSLANLLDKAGNAQVVSTKMAEKMVKGLVNKNVKFSVVGDGDMLDLGGKTLKFVSAPFLHWPETMFTYLEENHILFSCDAFGSHFCDTRMFNDLVGEFYPEFNYYYKVIMRPFAKNVRKALSKIEDIKIDMIAPSHGPILRRDTSKYINAYSDWSAELPVNNPKKLLIFYASAHGNTEAMARYIAEGIRDSSVETETIDVVEYNFAEIADAVEKSDGILVGSPTINADAVLPVWEVLSNLATINVKGKIAASFGSYAWSGEATSMLDERLRSLKFKVPEEGLKVYLVPSDEEISMCKDFGRKIASHLIE